MTKKKTAVFLYPHFSEYELSVAISVLMQGHKHVCTVGKMDQIITGESGLRCIPDISYMEVDPNEFDSVLLPGCMNITSLTHDTQLFDCLQRLLNEETIVGAISSSPYLLAKLGFLKGKTYTVGLNQESRNALQVFDESKYSGNILVKDGNLITARGRAFISFGLVYGKALGLEFDENWYGLNPNMGFN